MTPVETKNQGKSNHSRKHHKVTKISCKRNKPLGAAYKWGSYQTGGERLVRKHEHSERRSNLRQQPPKKYAPRQLEHDMTLLSCIRTMILGVGIITTNIKAHAKDMGNTGCGSCKRNPGTASGLGYTKLYHGMTYT